MISKNKLSLVEMNRIVLLLLLIAIPSALSHAELPEYKPPFQAKLVKRLVPKLVTDSFLAKSKNYEQPYLKAGNKRIGLRRINNKFMTYRDFIIVIHVDNEELFHIRFWGSIERNNFGWPFLDIPGDKGKIITDRGKNSITYTKPYKLPGGERAVFSFTIRPAGYGRVEVVWDPGISNKKISKLKRYSLSPWIELTRSTNYRSTKISIDGKDFVSAPDHKFTGKSSKKSYKTFSGKIKKFEFNVFLPEKRITVTMPDKISGTFSESFYEDKIGKRHYQAVVQMRRPPELDNRRILIDFGATPNVKSKRSTNAGIDFWKGDATHIPEKPTRNLMPNAGFNQDLRYFRWIHGGARYTPSDLPRYSIDFQNGRGDSKKCLLIRPVQRRAAPIVSFALPMKKGGIYTMSCYAKGDIEEDYFIFSPFSHSGSQFTHSYSARNKKTTRHKLTKDWKRYACTFKYDHGGVGLMLSSLSNGNILIDDIQLEIGDKASEFTYSPIDGVLITSNPDNLINSGTLLNAEFEIFGRKGKIELSLIDYYRKELWKKSYPVKGGDKIKLPFDNLKLGTGNFVVKAKFTPENGSPYYDYYRFSVMKFLRNKHATKNMFGTEMRSIGRISRAPALGHLFMVSGVGATVYGTINGPDNRILNKYGIENLVYMMANHSGDNPRYREFVKYQKGAFRSLAKSTLEAEKKIEEIAYLCARNTPQATRWALTGEIDKASAMLRNDNYKEYAKLLAAFHRGIKRGNPKAKLFPDAGTQAYAKIWGRRETEEKIRATSGTIKWDAFATHPYGAIDGTAVGTGDLDEEVCAHFINMLKKYGYEKAPIYFIEAFNIIATHIPEWGATSWGDRWNGGKPGYDWGLREYNQAAWIARGYLICLKYWPKVQHWDFWRHSPFFDLHLAPYAMLNAINTLGNLFGNPEFVEDIRPAAGIRAYVFQNKNGEGIAAVWYISDKVERGLISGPRLKLDFKNEQPEFIDLMGNTRKYHKENNVVSLPLNAAPIFIRSQNPQILVAALKNSEAVGGEVNINFTIKPDSAGNITARLFNLCGKELKGTLKMGNNIFKFVVPGKKSVTKILRKDAGNDPGKIYKFLEILTASLESGSNIEKNWNMHYFYVPYVKGTPDWKQIPGISINNRFTSKNGRFTNNNDLKANFKTAWNEKSFYLRVEVQDDHVVPDPEYFKKAGFKKDLYFFDACLEVYFDSGANGLSNRFNGYDDDDYRYDFAPGNPRAATGSGLVCRRVAAHMQLAGGLDMPSRKKANKNIKCNFVRTAKGYVYEITFEQPYLEPLQLRPGSTAGFALYLHDKDSLQDQTGAKGLSLSTRQGEHVAHRPQLWPQMILKK